MAPDDPAQEPAGGAPDVAELVWETHLGSERGWEIRPQFKGLAYIKTWHRADDKGKRWVHFSADHWLYGREDARHDHLGEGSVRFSESHPVPSVTMVEGEDAETPIAKRAEAMLRVLCGEPDEDGPRS